MIQKHESDWEPTFTSKVRTSEQLSYNEAKKKAICKEIKRLKKQNPDLTRKTARDLMKANNWTFKSIQP